MSKLNLDEFTKTFGDGSEESIYSLWKDGDWNHPVALMQGFEVEQFLRTCASHEEVAQMMRKILKQLEEIQSK